MIKKYAYLAISILNFLYNALILNLLWNWFITPLGFAEINFFWAIGLLLLAIVFDNSLTFQKNNNKKQSLKISIYVKTIIFLIGFICSFLV